MATILNISDARVENPEDFREIGPIGGGLQHGRGGGTSGPMSDDALKPRVDFLHTAFLWLAGAIVTVALALAGLILTVTNSTNARTDKVLDAVSTLNREAGVASTKLDATNQRLDAMDKKLDGISEKIDKIPR